jgi:ABC-type transport system substrate-binding protein
MRLNFPSLAVSSLALLLACSAWCETRPRYGGVLRVEVRASMQSLDPGADAGAAAQPFIAMLFDTLTGLDPQGRAVPHLATAWEQEGDRRWRLQLRTGVKFSDGVPLTAALAAQSLRNVNPNWSVRDIGDSVVIETEDPSPDLPAVLALPRNAIVERVVGGNPAGTGPFAVADWQPGRRLVLSARDDGWQTRPFLDSVEVQLGRTLREQAVDMDLGRADVAEASPEQLARPAPASRRVVATEPLELFALRFSHTNTAVHDSRVREAIALAVDRDSISNVLFQRQAEAAGGLLPNWLTGYAFLFPTAPRTQRARQLLAEARPAGAVTLVYAAADPLARLVAERIALNASDAGLTLRSAPSTQNIAVPDVELVRVRLASTDGATALAELARTDVLALPLPPTIASSPADVYRATVAALKDVWASPVVCAPVAYALAPRVRNWSMTRAAGWQLDEVWLAAAQAGARAAEARP